MKTAQYVKARTPTKQSSPAESPRVKVAYGRMTRVLNELTVAPNGTILVSGTPVQRRLFKYYRPYTNIEQYVRANPNNIKGVYEVIWDNGGGSRTFIDDTQKFETVVSAFFEAYSAADEESPNQQ
jgi:hypothetical protein